MGMVCASFLKFVGFFYLLVFLCSLLFVVVVVVVVFAMFGMLSPASRGALMTAAIVLFMFMGWDLISSPTTSITVSVMDTLWGPFSIILVHFNLRRENNLSIRTKWLAQNVSIIHKFHCTTSVLKIMKPPLSHPSPLPPPPSPFPLRAAAGYHAARLYKTLKGTDWKKASLLTAALYPGAVFGMGFFLNFFIWGEHSSGAVSITYDVIL